MDNKEVSLVSKSKYTKQQNILHYMANIELYDKYNLAKFYHVILKKHPELLLSKDSSGDTPIDLLKKSGYYERRKKMINKYQIQKQNVVGEINDL